MTRQRTAVGTHRTTNAEDERTTTVDTELTTAAPEREVA